MALRQPRPSLANLDEDWFPPPWNPSAAPAAEDETHVAPHSPRRAAQRSVEERPRRREEVDSGTGTILGIALAPAVSGVIALIASFVERVLDLGSLPIAIVAVLAAQAAGYALTASEAPVLGRAWLVGLAGGAVVLPVAALQTSLAREPYVSVGRDSATPAIVMACALAGLMIVLALTTAVWSRDAPEEAALLFMPLGLLIPAIAGIRSEVDEISAVRALAQAYLIAAGATVLAWSLPKAARPLLPPAALAVQFIALWAMGHGPSFDPTSGEVVPAIYAALLGLTVVLVVAVPILAFWLRRVLRMADVPARH